MIKLQGRQSKVELSYGARGKSAYQVALDNGFDGTEQEWLDSLIGPTGETGQDGYTPVKGVDYFDGETGPKGESGVYVGTDEPIDANVWIDPEGTPTEGLATVAYVDEKIEEFSGVYVGEDEPADANIWINPNGTPTEGMATEAYVDEKIAEIELMPGPQGKDYVLTEDDKAEIAGMVPVPDVDLTDYYTKTEIDELLANLPAGGDIPSGEEVQF
jgi:hypothetical protein